MELSSLSKFLLSKKVWVDKRKITQLNRQLQDAPLDLQDSLDYLIHRQN